MTQEALKLALEAMEFIPESGSMLGAHAEAKRLEAITAIKEALAQHDSVQAKPEPEQEPVVGTKTWFEDGKVVTQHLKASEIYKKPDEEEYLAKAYRMANELRCHLAIAPAPQRTWVGLTDDEIAKELYKFEAAGAWYQFARAIEAKLKERNA